MVSPAGVGGAAFADPSLGPSLQDVLAALRSPGDGDEESRDRDDAAGPRSGGFDDDDDSEEEEEEVSPSKFLLGLFDDEDVVGEPDQNAAAASAAPAFPPAAPSSAALAPLWDDNVALSFPSARHSGVPGEPQPELVASSSGSGSGSGSGCGSGAIGSSNMVADILGADEIEQLATGMLEMGSPMIAVSSPSAAASDAAASRPTCTAAVNDAVVDIGMDIGRPDGVPSSTSSIMTSRMRMASSWHLGPGANATAKGRSKARQEEDIGNNANSSGRRVLPHRRARSNPGIEYDDTTATTPANNGGGGTKRRSSGESAASVASVTSADGKPGKQIVLSGTSTCNESGRAGGGNASKKRKKSSTGGSSGTSGHKKTRPTTTKKKADAIAKQAAENLGLDPKTVPRRPKQAPNTFILFCNANRSRVKAENPDSKPSQMSSLLGEQWKALSDRGRKPYVDAAAKANKEYAVKLEAYNCAMERFRKTDDGKRWAEEQDRLLRQSVEKEGGVWEATGICTREKEDEEKAIVAVVAAAAAVKAQEDRQLKAQAALQRQEEEKLEKDRQLFEKANTQPPRPPTKPKSAFSFFSDALYEKRSLKENHLQLVVTPTTCTSDEDDSSCPPAILYDRLSQKEKDVYEVMAKKAQKTYQKSLKEYEQELERARSRAGEIIDMLDPKKRAAKVDQMIREVAAVRRQTPGHADWFRPDRQRLVRHQLDWRLRHAAKAGCTQAEFSRNLTMLYSREGREQEERRRLEQVRLQKEAQEKRIMAETEKMKQLQEHMQRVYQLQRLQQLEAAKQTMPYPGYPMSQAYYPHQAYPWGVMMPTQMANSYASYSVPTMSEGMSVPSQNTSSAHPTAAVASDKAAGFENSNSSSNSSSNNSNPLMALAMLAEWNDQRAQPQPSAPVDAQSQLNGSASTSAAIDEASSGAENSTKEAL